MNQTKPKTPKKNQKENMYKCMYVYVKCIQIQVMRYKIYERGMYVCV